MTTGPVRSPASAISPGTLLAAVLAGSLLLLLILPLVALVSFTSPEALARVANDPGARWAAEFTLYASGAAVAISLLTGVPLGYLLARRAFPGRTIVSAVIGLPLALPHLVAGLALYLLFVPRSPMAALAARLHLSVLESFWGVVLVMIYVSVPYLVLSSEAAFRAIDPSLRETARTLGAGPGTVFWTVTLPAAGRGVVAGALLAWARSISEIGGFLIVASTVYPSIAYSGPTTAPLSIYIFDLYSIGDTEGAAALSVWLLLIAFTVFLSVRWLEHRGALASVLTGRSTG